jgi:ribosomal-protein-alanine N-acetyltransferase
MKLLIGTAQEAGLMASAHAQAFDRPWDEAVFRDFLAQPGTFALVAVDEDPAGVVLCRAMAGEAEVLTLAVAPWARRRGVGRTLMTAALDLARETGAEAMFLEADVSNDAAVTLYAQLGFERSGIRKAYYDRGGEGRANALVMRLDLTSEAF